LQKLLDNRSPDSESNPPTDAAEKQSPGGTPSDDHELRPPKRATPKKSPGKEGKPVTGSGNDHEPLPRREDWQIQKSALKKKFPEGWKPRRRLSPDALAGIRALHEQFPEEYTTDVLARNFEVSPEAIRRILKSKWTPSPEAEIRRQERWFDRGKRVWARWAELGKKPPRRWRREGIVRHPSWNRKRGPGYDGRGDTSEDLNRRAMAQRRLAENLV
jgi:hypothetical protein